MQIIGRDILKLHDTIREPHLVAFSMAFNLSVILIGRQVCSSLQKMFNFKSLSTFLQIFGQILRSDLC